MHVAGLNPLKILSLGQVKQSPPVEYDALQDKQLLEHSKLLSTILTMFSVSSSKMYPSSNIETSRSGSNVISVSNYTGVVVADVCYRKLSFMVYPVPPIITS